MTDGVGFSPDNAPSQDELASKKPLNEPVGKVGSDQGIKIEEKPSEEISPSPKGFEIWSDGATRIYYPENPLVPSSEGIHLRVESPNVPLHPKNPTEWKAWLVHWAKTIGVGKVVSESGDLPDMWQSFVGKTEFSPEGHLVTEVIGRNPRGESWGKTVPFPEPNYDNKSSRLDDLQISKFKETLNRYFARFWASGLNNIELFSEEQIVSRPGSEHFEEVRKDRTSLPFPWQSDPMIITSTFDILAILEPHLKSGIHFMVGIENAPRRPWRDLKKSLESLAVAEAAAQLLEENNFEDKPFAAWTSIRATGSWFSGFQQLHEDEQFQDENIPIKWQKREYSGKDTRLARGGKDWKMNFHPHIYGARSKDELIKLTQRPKNEGGKDWEGIVAMSQKELLFVRDLLNEKLVPMIMANVKGKINI